MRNSRSIQERLLQLAQSATGPACNRQQDAFKTDKIGPRGEPTNSKHNLPVAANLVGAELQGQGTESVMDV